LNDNNELILKFLKDTNQPIFLTGKAGTGKTTLLRHIRDTTIKNFAIVAPTAVAAINAGGVTLHSFFQIPFGPLVPDLYDETTQVRYSEEKIKLLKSLELLIVDEISMVRADLIDFIDRSLKNARGFNMPFGGVQVLMIGDLYQLPPIAHDAWHILKNYYNSPYFFDSRVLKNVAMVTFQLEKVYRQSDPLFLDILNGIREGQLAAPLLDQLNTRFDQDQIETFKDEYVTLTTHNHLVTSINEECLNQLKTETHTFKAMVTGDFPKDAFPVDELLQLKVGAQIMFIKNDSSGKKQFYNGRSAKIIQLSENNIKVSFTDDATELEVEREVWNNLKYNLNEDENRITEVNTGSFSQYPFKLAWAITIHKSQGLTFDKVIVDASSSFAHGQAYVALSRCRSLEGLILKAPLKTENIITDKAVISFTNQTTIRKPNESLLEACKRSYQWDLIRDVFNFELINQKWAFLKNSKFNNDHENRLFKNLIEELSKNIENEVFSVANNFKNRELNKTSETTALKDDVALIDRLTKASTYFIPKLELLIAGFSKFKASKIYRDEQSDKILNYLSDCIIAFRTKLALFNLEWKEFSTQNYQTAYLSAHKSAEEHKKEAKKTQLVKEIINLPLYNDLLNWRKKVSEQRNVAEHMILSEVALQQIAEKLPKSTEQLAAIKNIGLGNAVDHGSQITRLVNAYLGTNELF
jgi:hypothetical protein